MEDDILPLQGLHDTLRTLVLLVVFDSFLAELGSVHFTDHIPTMYIVLMLFVLQKKLINRCSVDTIRAHYIIDQVCTNKFMRRCRWSERKCPNSPGCSGRRTGSHAFAPTQMSSYLAILKIVADRPTVKKVFVSLLSALAWLLFQVMNLASITVDAQQQRALQLIFLQLQQDALIDFQVFS